MFAVFDGQGSTDINTRMDAGHGSPNWLWTFCCRSGSIPFLFGLRLTNRFSFDLVNSFFRFCFRMRFVSFPTLAVIGTSPFSNQDSLKERGDVTRETYNTNAESVNLPALSKEDLFAECDWLIQRSQDLLNLERPDDSKELARLVVDGRKLIVSIENEEFRDLIQESISEPEQRVKAVAATRYPTLFHQVDVYSITDEIKNFSPLPREAPSKTMKRLRALREEYAFYERRWIPRFVDLDWDEFKATKSHLERLSRNNQTPRN
jgi:hypothetical protein